METNTAPPALPDRRQEFQSHGEYAIDPSRANYSRLLVERRYLDGLLALFICSSCGVIALDSLGWNGPHRPLCERCSDPEEMRL